MCKKKKNLNLFTRARGQRSAFCSDIIYYYYYMYMAVTSVLEKKKRRKNHTRPPHMYTPLH